MNSSEINLTPTATLFEIDASCSHNKQQPTNGMQSKKIPCRSWGIGQESSAGIVLVHGLGAHSGWFEALARRLKAKGIFVLSFDLTGFGKQINEPYRSYTQWLEETKTVCAYLRSIMPNKPIFLLGNSLGALITLSVYQSIQPDGLAILSPAFAGNPALFSLGYQLKHLIKAILYPNKEIRLPYATNFIASQESVQSWLDADQSRRHTVPGKLLLDVFFLTQRLKSEKLKISCPLFMMTAGLDKVVDNRTNELIFGQIISTNKRKSVFSGAMHDLPLDPAIDELTELLANWIYSLSNHNRLAII